ncbi:MAG: Na+/H+ antiporter NhaA [Actinomycetota bacterium]|nr:Na+/H+ antiporter NhaA [Actinomycetota bacterium]
MPTPETPEGTQGSHHPDPDAADHGAPEPRGVPPLASPRRPPKVLREFLRTETAGGVVLLVATVVALVWANSPWRAAYASVWATELSLRMGELSVAEDLRHWVDEGLMAIFFFVVGLEIKRELVAGELRSWRTAALPAVAALGGMVIPAALYTAVNLGQEGASGWGIPMATDIAFALGLVALLGSRVPSSLRLFLLTLAIVDDIGAIVIIAVFYSDGIRWPPLAGAAVLLLAVGLLPRARIYWLPAYAALAFGTWALVFSSGVHATIAGALLGLLTPARPVAPAQVVRRWAEDLSDEPSASEQSRMCDLARSAKSVTERLQEALHPLTSFVVIPLFALANAGITFDAGALSARGAESVVIGVVVGLVAGKILGISGFSFVAVRLGLGSLPPGVGWSQLVGVSAVAGIGFTVSLFIAGLALEGPQLMAAKLGILGASLLASTLGVGWLWAAARRAPTPE